MTDSLASFQVDYNTSIIVIYGDWRYKLPRLCCEDGRDASDHPRPDEDFSKHTIAVFESWPSTQY